jgi:hypothetical protein
VDFHLTVGNHFGGPGRLTLRDPLTWVSSGLLENNHKVSFSETVIAGNALNIFWEYFMPELAQWLVEQRVPFGIIATELPDGDGFNGRRDADWPARWAGFKIAAPHAKFIWCMVEETVPAYAAFAPSAFLELGYTDRLLSDAPPRTPTHDFSFTGTTNPHRTQILDRLAVDATIVKGVGLMRYDDQLETMRSGRVALALKQSPEWRWPSPARLGLLLHQRIPVAAEYTLLDDPVSRLIPTPGRDEDFAEWALKRLDRADLQVEADAALEIYRTRPMRDCVSRALDLTLR